MKLVAHRFSLVRLVVFVRAIYKCTLSICVSMVTMAASEEGGPFEGGARIWEGRMRES